MPFSKVHLVSFDIPYPPDYGGVVEVYSRIKTLTKIGLDIDLHAFSYGRKEVPAYLNGSLQVHYYKRKPIPTSFTKPFIVESRYNLELLDRLLKDRYPVILEGHHSTVFLEPLIKAGKKVFVRIHNKESEYYQHLGKHSDNLLRKLYFKRESRLLEKWDTKLSIATGLWVINQKDVDFYKSINSNTTWVPPFHLMDQCKSLPGKGTFALYHGNLSVSENREAADFLVKIWPQVGDSQLVIAGKGDADIAKRWSDKTNVTVKLNPDQFTLESLLQDAQLHLLPTFQSTGVKLKLIQSLMLGRFVLVNPEMVEGTQLEDLTIVCKDKHSWINNIKTHMHQEFSQDDINGRIGIFELGGLYDNERLGQLIKEQLEV